MVPDVFVSRAEDSLGCCSAGGSFIAGRDFTGNRAALGCAASPVVEDLTGRFVAGACNKQNHLHTVLHVLPVMRRVYVSKKSIWESIPMIAHSGQLANNAFQNDWLQQ